MTIQTFACVGYSIKTILCILDDVLSMTNHGGYTLLHRELVRLTDGIHTYPMCHMNPMGDNPCGLFSRLPENLYYKVLVNAVGNIYFLLHNSGVGR